MNRSARTLLLATMLAGPALQAQSITVAPTNESVVVGLTRQYTATVSGLTNTSITWSAGGVVGGNSTAGTISSTGLYTAPAALPGQNPVQITARSAANNKVVGMTYVSILSLGPVITSVSPNPIPTGTVTVTIQGTGFQPGATVIDTYSSYGAIQLTTTSVTPTTIKATGYQGPGSSAKFAVRNAGSGFSNTLSVPIGSSGPSTFTLKVVNGTGSGTYPAGTVVPIAANAPPSGESFQSWTGATVANVSSATTALTMPAANTTVTATYTSTSKPTFSLTVIGGSGSGTYTQGTVVPLISNTPPAGQSFQSWTGATVANANAATTTLTMPAANITMTATFVSVPTFPLTVVNGTGSGSYPAGANVSIVANQAPAGQAFQNWSGTTVANPNAVTTTLSMPAVATTVTANYASIPVPTISQVNPATVPVGVFSLTITGSGFQAGSQVSLGGKALTTVFVSGAQLTGSGFNSTSGTANLVVTNGSAASAPFSLQLGPANALVTVNAARHFLQQAAFGPTSSEAANVQQLGFQGWLNQQLAMPKVSNYSGIGSQGSFSTPFLTNAVNQPDQLRQRVAFALSQIMVTSVNKNIWNTTTAPFEEMLMTDAFGSFRQILNDVTLAPAMGQFLDMANNSKANATNTVLPNENYAREVMQLFSIGTFLLNTDGTRQVDSSGNPIPTYDQTTIANFAKVFTGWTYAPATPGGTVVWGAYINENAPMVPYAPMHDTTQKTLLQYAAPSGVFTTLAPGQSAQTDLTQALDNIFFHPNVGPFIGKQIIQHLVKSNPSPAYVQRVANAFNDNGSGLRGDMRSVITAVLLDPEARQNDVAGMTQAKDGHLQEPMLYLAGFLRAMGATVDNTNYFAYDLGNMSQDIYDAPSVFNYFSPGYVVPGFGVVGPEFQIYTPYSAVYRDNIVSTLFGAYANNINSYGPGTVVDLTPFVALAGNPQNLVDALDLTLTNGLAPASFKTILLNAIQAESGGNLRRVQTALYLLLSSGYYNVWN